MKLFHLLPTAFLFIFSAQGCGQSLLGPVDFQDKIGPGTQLIDVRTPGEFASGHIPGAINIDYYDAGFEAKVLKLNPARPVMVYCKSGGRSGSAAKTLAAAGYKELYDLQGGMMAWERAGLPVEKEAEPLSKDPVAPGNSGLSDMQFDSLIRIRDLVVVDFFAPWCLPCKKMAPSLERIKKSMADSGVTVQKIDVDQNKELSKKMGVSDIPVLIFFVRGVQKLRTEGFIPEDQIREHIKRLKNEG